MGIWTPVIPLWLRRYEALIVELFYYSVLNVYLKKSFNSLLSV